MRKTGSVPHFTLSNIEPFDGSGLYAIYYEGDTNLYKDIEGCSPDLKQDPIYIGKATGARGLTLQDNGSYYSSGLYRKLKSHAISIEAAKNLDISEFSCQYSVMADIWATLGEPYMLSICSPLRNERISGFGFHDPGKGRRLNMRSDWDTLHPGRQWAEYLQPQDQS